LSSRPRAHVVETDAEGLTWIKSTASDDDPSGGCVEMTVAETRVLVRCSRERQGSRLTYRQAAWASLISWLSGNRTQ
jgi:hypothetical protein